MAAAGWARVVPPSNRFKVRLAVLLGLAEADGGAILEQVAQLVRDRENARAAAQVQAGVVARLATEVERWRWAATEAGLWLAREIAQLDEKVRAARVETKLTLDQVLEGLEGPAEKWQSLGRIREAIRARFERAGR